MTVTPESSESRGLIRIGDGFRFSRLLDASAKSLSSLVILIGPPPLSLSCRWPVTAFVLCDEGSRDMAVAELPPLCSRFGIRLLLRFETCRLTTPVEGRVLPLPLLLREGRSLPLMTSATGGGCNIHATSSRELARVTIAGWKSFTAGLR